MTELKNQKNLSPKICNTFSFHTNITNPTPFTFTINTAVDNKLVENFHHLHFQRLWDHTLWDFREFVDQIMVYRVVNVRKRYSITKVKFINRTVNHIVPILIIAFRLTICIDPNMKLDIVILVIHDFTLVISTLFQVCEANSESNFRIKVTLHKCLKWFLGGRREKINTFMGVGLGGHYNCWGIHKWVNEGNLIFIKSSETT